jgi:hypothetical protein
VHAQAAKVRKLEIRNSGGAESLLPWELRREIRRESHIFRGSFTGKSLRSLYGRAGYPFPVELKIFAIAATRGKIRKSRQDDNRGNRNAGAKGRDVRECSEPKSLRRDYERRSYFQVGYDCVESCVGGAQVVGVRSSGKNQQVLLLHLR